MTHQMSLIIMPTVLKNGKLTNNGHSIECLFLYIKLGGGEMK